MGEGGLSASILVVMHLGYGARRPGSPAAISRPARLARTHAVFTEPAPQGACSRTVSPEEHISFAVSAFRLFLFVLLKTDAKAIVCTFPTSRGLPLDSFSNIISFKRDLKHLIRVLPYLEF